MKNKRTPDNYRGKVLYNERPKSRKRKTPQKTRKREKRGTNQLPKIRNSPQSSPALKHAHSPSINPLSKKMKLRNKNNEIDAPRVIDERGSTRRQSRRIALMRADAGPTNL